jgi:hypothetical protein
MEDELRRASFGWSSQVGEFMDPSGLRAPGRVHPRLKTQNGRISGDGTRSSPSTKGAPRAPERDAYSDFARILRLSSTARRPAKAAAMPNSAAKTIQAHAGGDWYASRPTMLIPVRRAASAMLPNSPATVIHCLGRGVTS